MRSTTMHTFQHLTSQDFIHPAERKLSSALSQMKPFQFISSKVVEIFHEDPKRLYNLGNAVKISDLQYPKIHTLLINCCRALNMDYVPEFYMSNENHLGGYTYGIKRPAIILTAGLLEKGTIEDISWVIAHELSHIKCNHVLHSATAQLMSQSLQAIPGGDYIRRVADVGMVLTLKNWAQASEFSADRGAHLVAGNPDAGAQVLMKLAGGRSSILGDEPSVDAFVDQAKEIQKSRGNIVNRFLAGEFSMSHPFTSIRAACIYEWNNSLTYMKLQSTAYSETIAY